MPRRQRRGPCGVCKSSRNRSSVASKRSSARQITSANSLKANGGCLSSARPCVVRISPRAVVPQAIDSASPCSMGWCRPSAAERREAMTCRIQSGSAMPGFPSGASRLLNSRCVWAFASPGIMATLPKSTGGCDAWFCPTATIRSPAIVSTPPAIGGPQTGNTYRARRANAEVVVSGFNLASALTARSVHHRGTETQRLRGKDCNQLPWFDVCALFGPCKESCVS